MASRALARLVRGRQPAQRSVGDERMVDSPWLQMAFQQATSQTGVRVTVEGSFRLAAVWACVRVLSDTVGSLPCCVYRRTEGGADGELAPSSASWRILHDRPNPEMTAMDCWSLVVTHLNTWGNAYLGKDFLGDEVVALWPIAPPRVQVARRRGVKVYLVKSEDGTREREYGPDEIIHVKGMSLDGLTGLSPIEHARETIGAGLAMQEHANRTFANGAMPGGVMSVRGSLTEEAGNRLRRAWNALFRGVRNAGKVAVLEDGATFTPVQFNSRDAQFVESMKMTVQDIARVFRVPVSLIEGDKGGSLTYSTVEADAIHFVTHSIRPWLVRIEQALAADPDLFPISRAGMPAAEYPEFDVDVLLRADVKTRAEVHALELDPVKGWKRPREVRRSEGLPYDSSFDIPTDPAPQEAPVAV